MFDFLRGMQFFVEGIGLLWRPGIKRFVVIPVLINIVLFAILFAAFAHYVQELNHWLSQLLPTWLQWLSIFVWLLFLISFFLIVAVIFVIVANFIAAPFNSLLSEKIEYLLTGAILPANGVLMAVADVPRVIARQFAILLYYLPRALACLILFFIPVIQVAAPFLWFYYNAWFMLLTYYDYPSDNHRQPFKAMRVSLERNKAMGLGFGTAVLFCAMVPVLNLIAIPAAVAGATKMWVEKR